MASWLDVLSVSLQERLLTSLLAAPVALAGSGGHGPRRRRRPTRSSRARAVTHDRRRRRQGRQPGHACSGTSAAGALERATAGDWAGTWYDGVRDYSVTTIKGETPQPSPAAAYWGFYVNGSRRRGPLRHDAAAGRRAASFAPTSTRAAHRVGAARALAASRRRWRPASPFDGHRQAPGDDVGEPARLRAACNAADPRPARRVTGGGASATTDADGKATLTLTHAGPADAARVQRPRDVRSAREPVCVTARRRRLLRHRQAGRPAACGDRRRRPAAALDRRRAAAARSSAIGEQQRYARGKAPRTLRGTSPARPSGIADDPPAAHAPHRQALRALRRRERALGADARCGAESGRSSRSATARRGPTCCRGADHGPLRARHRRSSTAPATRPRRDARQARRGAQPRRLPRRLSRCARPARRSSAALALVALGGCGVGPGGRAGRAPSALTVTRDFGATRVLVERRSRTSRRRRR